MISVDTERDFPDKISEILHAAQRRFGSYGFEKTAMYEIAADLGMSKASLYYYFPDKESLYKAVVEKETEEYFQTLSGELKAIQDPNEAFQRYGRIRIGYFRTLQNLTRVRLEENNYVRKIIHELRSKFRERERNEIMGLLNRGEQQYVFGIADREYVANLFLDSLRGISIVFMKNQESAHLNEIDFSQLEKQIQLYIDIFVKGISNK